MPTPSQRPYGALLLEEIHTQAKALVRQGEVPRFALTHPENMQALREWLGSRAVVATDSKGREGLRVAAPAMLFLDFAIWGVEQVLVLPWVKCQLGDVWVMGTEPREA